MPRRAPSECHTRELPKKAKKPDCVPIWWLSGYITVPILAVYGPVALLRGRQELASTAFWEREARSF